MVLMILKINWKSVIRRVGVVLVILAYYLWLTMAILSFGHIDDKESMILSSKSVSVEYHKAIIDSIYHATDNIIDVALVGFPICVCLIVFILKKVR